jgi:serine/threonine protein phosphatase PrpC
LGNNKREIIELSKDHKPELEVEKERIIRMGGKVEKYNGKMYYNQDNGIKSGPYRVWVKNEIYPGLAMSRSIGDLIGTKVGVIAEPEILEQTITSDCKYIVIASDGVWEFLSNKDVSNIVYPFYLNNDPKGACDKLIQVSTEWWEKVKFINIRKIVW